MKPVRVKELMWGNHPLIVSESVTVREAAERLIVGDCDLLAVRDKEGRLSGVVAESSVVRCLLANPPAEASIAPLVNRHVESVREDAAISSVLHLFRSACNSAVPVVDEQQRLCGLLLRRDAISEILNSATRINVRPELGDEIGESATNQSRSARLDQAEHSATLPSPPSVADLTPATPTAPAKPDTPATPPELLGSPLIPPNDGLQQRPHFLRGDDARRRLNYVADRNDGGICDPPW